MELANFDDDEGHVVGQGAVAPRGRALEDGLFHFGKCSCGRLADQLLKALNAEHVLGPVKHFDEPIGVENQTVAGRELDFRHRLRRRKLGEITEDTVLRIEQTQRALRDEYCWRLAGGRKGHAASALTKTGCGHGEIKTVLRDAIMYEVVEALQQTAGLSLTFQRMKCFRVDAVGHQSRRDTMARHVAQDEV